MAEILRDLSPGVIGGALRGSFGTPSRVFAEVGSTNAEASEWEARGAPEGALVVADHQTAGRGRLGRRWLSQPGRALLFSLVLRPEISSQGVSFLTTALGVACAEGIEEAARLPAALVWPNDVTVNGRKLAGILVESRFVAMRLAGAVAGVGINVKWPASQLPDEIAGKATSISIEQARRCGARIPSRATLLAAVLFRFEHWYAGLDRADTRVELLARARERSEVLGRRVEARFGDGTTVTGLATAITDAGGLEIESEDRTVVLIAGDVEQLCMP